MKEKVILVIVLCIPLFLFPNLLFSKTINEDFFLRFPWSWNVNQITVYNTSAYIFSSGKEIIMSLFSFKKNTDFGLNDIVNIVSQNGMFNKAGEKTFNNVETAVLNVSKTINEKPVSSILYIMEGSEGLYIFSFESKNVNTVDEILNSIKIKK